MVDRPTMTLEEFAALDGVPGRDVLRRIIKDNADFPATPGTNGVAYQIDVAAAIEWLRTRDERRRAEEEERAAAARQLALDMLGTDSAANVDRGPSASERKAMLEEELVAMKVAERRGELIRKSSIEAAIANVLTTDAQQRRTFVARLAKHISLTREQLHEAELMMEQDRRQFAAALHSLGEASASGTA